MENDIEELKRELVIIKKESELKSHIIVNQQEIIDLKKSIRKKKMIMIPTKIKKVKPKTFQEIMRGLPS